MNMPLVLKSSLVFMLAACCVTAQDMNSVSANFNNHAALAAGIARADKVLVYEVVTYDKKFETDPKGKPIVHPEKQIIQGESYYLQPAQMSPEDAKTITELYQDPASLKPSTNKNGGLRDHYDGYFDPDFCIEWQTSAGNFRAILGRQKDVAMYGPKEQLYCLVQDKAYATLKKIVEHYRAYHPELKEEKYDFNFKNHEALSESISKADKVELYEGLSRGMFTFKAGEKDTLEDRLKKANAVKLHGFAFYQEALRVKPEDAKKLAELYADPQTFAPFRGYKKCGGFHPDFLIEWTLNGEKFSVMLCFGCHDMETIGPATTLFCQITPQGFEQFKTLLDTYKKHPDAGESKD